MANLHESDDDDDDATQDLPLSAAFTRARQLHQKNNSGILSASERRDAVRLLTSSQAMIESLGLFSSNEDIEDLATAYIKYLLVPFFLADILASSSSKALQERVQQVNTALCQHRNFLEICSQYQLLGSYASVYQREEEGLKIDHSMRREIKVAWFKQQRALNAQLQALQGASGSRGGDQDGDEGGTGALDEEQERQLWLLHVELSVIKSLEARPALKQEAEMLELRLEMEARATPAQKEAEARQAAETEASKRAMMAKLHTVMSQLDGNRRQNLRGEVFRPSHTLPTITVEQAGEMEYQQMVAREAASARQQAEEKAADNALPAEDREDRELHKVRAMDDFKDANPRGWGNSKLRPCG